MFLDMPASAGTSFDLTTFTIQAGSGYNSVAERAPRGQEVMGLVLGFYSLSSPFSISTLPLSTSLLEVKH